MAYRRLFCRMRDAPSKTFQKGYTVEHCVTPTRKSPKPDTRQYRIHADRRAVDHKTIMSAQLGERAHVRGVCCRAFSISEAASALYPGLVSRTAIVTSARRAVHIRLQTCAPPPAPSTHTGRCWRRPASHAKSRCSRCCRPRYMAVTVDRDRVDRPIQTRVFRGESISGMTARLCGISLR